jgi:hypothetical protein
LVTDDGSLLVADSYNHKVRSNIFTLQ